MDQITEPSVGQTVRQGSSNRNNRFERRKL